MTPNLLHLYARNRGAANRRFDVVQADASTEATIYLYDAIVSDESEAEYWGGVAPAAFVKALQGVTAPTINLRINSPGGSVFGARAIEQALREHPANVVAHIDGLAASAATFVAMAANDIVMQPGALFMVHKAWCMAFGNEDDLLATAALLGKIDGTLAATYVARSGAALADVNAWMAAETWFTADEALAAGFVDRIADDGVQARTKWDLSAFANAPTVVEPQPVRVDMAALLRRVDVAELPA